MKLHLYIFALLGLISLSSCNTGRPYFKNLASEHNTKERQNLAKSFAEQFFAKCEKQDYSEIQGFNMDVNFKQKVSSETIEKICKSFDRKLGKITIGNLYSAKTRTFPKDYMDFFEFNIKNEKNDSIKFLRIGLTRDKDFLSAFSVTKDELINYRKKSKSK